MPDPAVVRCPHCRAKLRLPPTVPAGKKIHCPKCKTDFVPANPHEPAKKTAVKQRAGTERGKTAPPKPSANKSPKRWVRGVATVALAIFVCALVGGVSIWVYTSLTAPPTWTTAKRPHFPRRPAPWIQDFASAQQQAAEEKKDILLSFEASDWNAWDQKIQIEIRNRPEFQDRVAKDFVLVKVDFPRHDAARTNVKDSAANEQLQKQFGVSVFPTFIVTDAQGLAYGMLGYQTGSLDQFINKLEALKKDRAERDRLLTAIEQAEGPARLRAAKRALDFFSGHKLLQPLKKLLPSWNALAGQLDPKNEHGFSEAFFHMDWNIRRSQVKSAGLKPLLREADEWKKKYGSFKDKEQGALFCWVLAWAKGEVEDYEGAFQCIDEGLKLEPKNPQTRYGLQAGPASLGLGSGTAFAIDAGGHFLTNFHVAGGPGKMFLQFPDQKRLLPARLVAEKPDLDLAVIKVDLPMSPALVPLRITTDHIPTRGEQVGAWGFPLGTLYGHGLKLTKGAVSALPEAATNKMLMLDLKVNPGNSGGPLCDARGNVIGIVSARTGRAQVSLGDAPIESYGMAVTSTEAVPFLRESKIPFLANDPAAPSISWDELDRRVSPAVAMVLKAFPKNPVTKDLALTDGAITEKGRLDFGDGRDSDPIRQQCFAKRYKLKLEGGKSYRVDMASKELDAFLRLEDPQGKELAQDDDSGGDQDARIYFTCPADGVYVIVASTFQAGGRGSFVLKVTEERPVGK